MRKAIEVYLAACNRLYTSTEWMGQHEVAVPAQFTSVYVPDQTIGVVAGVVADIDAEGITKGIRHVFHSLDSSKSASNYRDYFEGKHQSNRLETDASSVVARVEKYVQIGWGYSDDKITSILVQETASGVDLILTYLVENEGEEPFSWVDHISYRGDYSIRWELETNVVE